MTEPRHLLLLPCSQVKRRDSGELPAIERYDGPMYRVLRNFLRRDAWPEDISVAVLSAKYGLIGALAPTDFYDQRMSPETATALLVGSGMALKRWSSSHTKISLFLGKDYLPALDLGLIERLGMQRSLVTGPIGLKLHGLRNALYESRRVPRLPEPPPDPTRPLYFLPDWDDMLDVGFDFSKDKFSAAARSERVEVHGSQILSPESVCDGVLVSLAQHFGGSSKGVLKRFAASDVQSLAPRSIRNDLGLSSSSLLFGDCGAFSYVQSPLPTITNQQALAFYQLYGFDFGASVDHLALPLFDEAERQRRVALTRSNAEAFINLYRERRYSFVPVGVIQGVSAESYGRQIKDYIDMGYRHVAIGGLVPLGDRAVLEVVREVVEERCRLHQDSLWVHLFGIFRPRIQPQLRELGINSFDSASYFRKAWLRSDQNYLGVDGKWYAAIRVPMTSDPRTRKRLAVNGTTTGDLERQEARAMRALHDFAMGQESIESVLEALTDYDRLLSRQEAESFADAYRRTLEAKPWKSCPCKVCRELGIDVLIFRGYNRNKRRGVHNTRMLFQSIQRGGVPASE